MVKGYLITLPDHDIVTHYLSTYAKQTFSVAEEHDFRIIPLENMKANSNDFRSYVTNNKVDFVVFNGHGNGTSVTGQLDKPIITAGINHELLTMRVGNLMQSTDW